MAPTSHCLGDGVKFLDVGWGLGHLGRQFLAEVGNRMALLREHNTNAMGVGICFHHENMEKYGKANIRVLINACLSWWKADFETRVQWKESLLRISMKGQAILA